MGLFGVGYNRFGQLGIAPCQAQRELAPFDGETEPTMASATFCSTLCLTKQGLVLEWGNSTAGGVVELPSPVASLSCSEQECIAVSSDQHHLYLWANADAKESLRTIRTKSVTQFAVPGVRGMMVSTQAAELLLVGQTEAEAHPGCAGRRITGGASSEAHTMVLTTAGELGGWGVNLHGQLGLGHTNECEPEIFHPVNTLGGIPIRAVACGKWHTIVLSSDGDVYSWGRGDDGQLGHGTNQGSSSPVLVEAIEDAQAIACGARHCVALVGGEAWTWGWNKYGQLGRGEGKSKVPSRMNRSSHMTGKCAGVTCGSWHTVLWTIE